MANPHSLNQQVVDATFLERRFGLTPREASELVARNGVAPERVREATEKLPQRDPLKGTPKPDEPVVERPRDVDEQRLKPVLHENNDRVGGG